MKNTKETIAKIVLAIIVLRFFEAILETTEAFIISKREELDEKEIDEEKLKEDQEFKQFFFPEGLSPNSLAFLAGADDLRDLLIDEYWRSYHDLDGIHEELVGIADDNGYDYTEIYELVQTNISDEGIINEEQLDNLLEYILWVEFGKKDIPNDERFHCFVRKLSSLKAQGAFVRTWLGIHDELLMMVMEDELEIIK